MRTLARHSACFTSLMGLQVGCVIHDVKYQPYVKWRSTPTQHAVAVYGDFDDARTYLEKVQLPHNSVRQRYELTMEGLNLLMQQLGSHDYVLIGEVFGSGNAWANHHSLKEALCKKAAQYGGDVVFIFKQQVLEEHYVYTTPGYSTTNSSATAYGFGNYATAYGTSHTTYMPSQTYAGVMYKPLANGLVFKYAPGSWADRLRLLEADDATLTMSLVALAAIDNDSTLSWKEFRLCWRQIVAGIQDSNDEQGQ